MSERELLKRFKLEKKEIPVLQEDPFARIAFIIENVNNGINFEQEVDKVLLKDPDEFAKQSFQGINNDSIKLVERNDGQKFLMNPLYVVEDVRNLAMITKIAKTLEPVSWIVYYCKTKSDLLYALIIQKMGYGEDYKDKLDRYSVESVSKLAIVRRVRDYTNSMLQK